MKFAIISSRQFLGGGSHHTTGQFGKQLVFSLMQEKKSLANSNPVWQRPYIRNSLTMGERIYGSWCSQKSMFGNVCQA